jgi:hypothetical protein
MPDERTYGFSLQDATELANSIGSGEGSYPEIKPRGGADNTPKLFGFVLGDEKLLADKSVGAQFFALDGELFGDLVGTDTLYDPANWYGTVPAGTKGICYKQGGKYYALQSPCGPEEYL